MVEGKRVKHLYVPNPALFIRIRLHEAAFQGYRGAEVAKEGGKIASIGSLWQWFFKDPCVLFCEFSLVQLRVLFYITVGVSYTCFIVTYHFADFTYMHIFSYIKRLL